MNPSQTQISEMIKELNNYYERYKWNADAEFNIEYLKMGFPLAVRLMKLGQEGFLEEEILMIDKFIECCNEIGIVQ
jgi:hypothetical protein